MTLEIGRLEPHLDRGLFWTSYHWLKSSPPWRQDTEAVFGTLDREEYMKARWADNRIDIGVFDDGAYIAKVALHLVAKNIYEVSLEAMRTADPAVIIEAGRLIRDQLFGWYGAEQAAMWILARHAGMKAIARAIGFVFTGVTMLRRTPAGRVMEWQLFTLRIDHEQQEQATDDPATTAVLQRHQYVRLATSS